MTSLYRALASVASFTLEQLVQGINANVQIHLQSNGSKSEDDKHCESPRDMFAIWETLVVRYLPDYAEEQHRYGDHFTYKPWQ